MHVQTQLQRCAEESFSTHMHARKVEGRVDTGDEDAWDRLRLGVLLHVAVQVGARQPPQDRCVREANLRTIVTASSQPSECPAKMLLYVDHRHPRSKAACLFA